MTKNNMRELQELWAYNKYWVMAKSPKIYNDIRLLFKNNQLDSDIINTFNNLLQEAETIKPNPKHLIVAYQHIWGYFKKIATDTEKETYLKLMIQVSNEPLKPLIYLQELTKKYQIKYLISSRIIKEGL